MTDNLGGAYDVAYQKARTKLRRCQPADLAAAGGAFFDAASGLISLRYVNEDYHISWPGGEVAAAGGEATPAVVKTVLLHYLLRAAGQPLAGRLVSFKEITGGGVKYLDMYNKRIIDGLLAVFGSRPALMTAAGKLVGGARAIYGQYGLSIDILPRLPVIFALWAGYDELPARVTVLYDASAPFYLPAEDLIEATAVCVHKLAEAAKKLTAG
ncbi:DUF3786 domain-containing protein [Anaeroselena agilis]|uniref:DUF3786 domain-containing protein n=1 Tax=Anaeroselena agilis TaxID=3063788 RepID=A0ABU3P1K8_9FIRM|nr:DUF3786 domain-containing protein [Selenomonadales bacterium 4137-cl]